jgi:hypothetical protein
MNADWDGQKLEYYYEGSGGGNSRYTVDGATQIK